MDEQQRLQALLQQAGLGEFSQYFTGDVEKLITEFGFKGPKQKEQFKQLFQGFDPSKYLQAAAETEERYGKTTGMLGERLAGQVGGLKFDTRQGLMGARGKSTNIMAESGFGGFGAAERTKDMSIRDILQRATNQQAGYQRQYASGMLSAEKERGTGRGAVYAALQDYLNRQFARAETIYGLDPTGGAGGGGDRVTGTYYIPTDPTDTTPRLY